MDKMIADVHVLHVFILVYFSQLDYFDIIKWFVCKNIVYTWICLWPLFTFCHSKAITIFHKHFYFFQAYGAETMTRNTNISTNNI